MSQQLSVEPVSCDALPASNNSLHSYVVSPIMSAVQDTLQPADDAASATANRQLDISTECAIDIIQHCPDYSNGTSAIQSGLSTEPTEAAILHIEDASQQPKVSKIFCASTCLTVGAGRHYVFGLTVRLYVYKCIHVSIHACQPEAFSSWLAVDF